jgi:uncharacterized membrane protein required for colicin V production
MVRQRVLLSTWSGVGRGFASDARREGGAEVAAAIGAALAAALGSHARKVIRARRVSRAAAAAAVVVGIMGAEAVAAGGRRH